MALASRGTMRAPELTVRPESETEMALPDIRTPDAVLDFNSMEFAGVLCVGLLNCEKLAVDKCSMLQIAKEWWVIFLLPLNGPAKIFCCSRGVLDGRRWRPLEVTEEIDMGRNVRDHRIHVQSQVERLA